MTNQEPGKPNQLPDPFPNTTNPTFAQQWGYQIPQEPAKKSHKKAWIIGGVSAVVVAASLAIGATAFLITGSDDDSKKIDPTSWESNRDMMEGILAAGAACDSFTGEFDETSTCMNSDESSYLLGVGTEASKDIRIAGVLAEKKSNNAVAWDTEWAVACVGMNALEDCQKLSDAFGSTNKVVDTSDIGTVTSDSLSSSSPTPEKSSTAFSDGTHLVGSDVQPGTYRNEGTSSCYWARLSGTGGTVDDVIANDNPRGQSYVTIDPTDTAFQSKNCGTWEMVE